MGQKSWYDLLGSILAWVVWVVGGQVTVVRVIGGQVTVGHSTMSLWAKVGAVCTSSYWVWCAKVNTIVILVQLI